MNFEEFLRAVKDNQLEKVRFCLTEHPEFINSMDENDQMPLHLAAEEGHESMTELLLQAGSSADAPTKSGWTPLHLAAGRGHMSVAKLLLQRLDPSSINFSINDYRWTPLHLAAVRGHESMVELLHQAGIPIDSADNRGMTPLHYAVRPGHVSVIEILLRFGSSIDLKDGHGWIPLQYAAYDKNLPIVRILKACSSHLDLSTNEIQMSEAEILEIRDRIYFDFSLVSRLLFQLKI